MKRFTRNALVVCAIWIAIWPCLTYRWNVVLGTILIWAGWAFGLLFVVGYYIIDPIFNRGRAAR
jgi:hypothetical protein